MKIPALLNNPKNILYIALGAVGLYFLFEGLKKQHATGDDLPTAMGKAVGETLAKTTVGAASGFISSGVKEIAGAPSKIVNDTLFSNGNDTLGTSVFNFFHEDEFASWVPPAKGH